MLEIILLSITIAVALSVDASLACFAYATNKTNITINYAPFFIGAFHFIFPFVSYTFFKTIFEEFNIESIGKLISSLIFVLLGIICFFEKDTKQSKLFGMTSIILLAVGVSIDSLLVGISLCDINSIIIPATIFGIISFTFSFLSIILGRIIAKRITAKLDYLVGIFFIVLGLLVFFEKISFD